MKGKIELECKPFAPGSRVDHKNVRPVRFSLPYYRAKYFSRPTYIHKVRRVYAHWDAKGLRHLSIRFVCGNDGSSTKGRLISNPGKPVNRCKRCWGI